jgi:hypothetical protein
MFRVEEHGRSDCCLDDAEHRHGRTACKEEAHSIQASAGEAIDCNEIANWNQHRVEDGEEGLEARETSILSRRQETDSLDIHSEDECDDANKKDIL